MCRTSTPAKSSTNLGRRIRLHWRLKLAMLVGLTFVFCVPYVYLAHHAWFAIRPLPLLAIDNWAGFRPGWVWVYQSVYLITGTLPWLATRREELKRYLFGFALLTVISFAVYVFFPTAAPRTAVTDATGLYQLLLWYDGPYNAMPSLHAGFLYFTLAFARRVYGRPPVMVSMVVLTWSMLILYSTLATKEHYVVDLIVGVLLAMGCDAAAWQSRASSTGSNGQDG